MALPRKTSPPIANVKSPLYSLTLVQYRDSTDMLVCRYYASLTGGAGRDLVRLAQARIHTDSDAQ